jgi:hypothetical protein
MGATVHFHSSDEGRIGLVHDYVSRPDFFEDMFIHISIVRMHHYQVVHIIELVKVFHLFEVVDYNFLLLGFFVFCRLDLLQ